MSPEGEANGGPQVEAWGAAIIYGANPNLIYMQATAMGESLYLAFFIWAVVYFAEFARGGQKALWKCGGCVVAACLTRYDGWFLRRGAGASDSAGELRVLTRRVKLERCQQRSHCRERNS